jgi:hypothetical protein
MGLCLSALTTSTKELEMPLPLTNDFTGRQWRIITTGVSPLANTKIGGGIWTGGTPGDIYTMIDAAGRALDWVYPADGSAVTIHRLGWLSGPVTITSMPHGEVQLYLDTK